MTLEGKEGKSFGKIITPGKVRGSVVIRNLETGNEVGLTNPVKEKDIPSELLDNLAAFVMEAFPVEFEGTEGASQEQKLIKRLTKRYLKEQPIEVADRTLPILAAHGIDAESIAGAIFSRSDLVRTALNLDSISKDAKNEKLERLQGVILSHWPSSGN